MNEKAFPNPHLRDGSGMSLRDYFAAKAMQAIIMTVDDKDDMSAPITESAYKWADAMMKAREA
jgi:D-alanyl-D-alanine carboxypeptidase